ncbi:MAG: D-aminoacylase, partial [Spirochaetia bacterium]|nr:D-aminoacylase [Spirochaetia bacterium]
MKYDYFFRNATIIDGSGQDSFVGDVAIKDDMIVKVSQGGDSPSGTALDASGLVLCPGFIDIHGHSELEVLKNPAMDPKILQGITTEVAGNCGIVVYPLNDQNASLHEQVQDVLGHYEPFAWKSFAEYAKVWKEEGSGTNMAFMQAHSPLRFLALGGNANRPATAMEVSAMCRLLEKSFKEGCIGFSTGLYYAPCLFADRRELLDLLRVTKQYDRLFAVHLRCEGNDVLEAIEEVLDLARLTGVRLEISHLKAIGRVNQGLVPKMLVMLEQARGEGIDVLFDQYPYEYGSTSLFSLLPPHYLRLSREDLQKILKSPKERSAIKEEMQDPDGWDSLYELCGWDNITVMTLDSNRQYEGLTLTEIASLRSQGPFDSFFDLLMAEKGTALMTDITQSQDSIKRILAHPLMCFGTDALYAGAKTHPRSYQAAVHLLDRYGMQQDLLPLEMLIRKMTSEPAKRLRLADRGKIMSGFKADLVIFDPLSLKDNSTERDPMAKSDGMVLVMVNGKLSFFEGEPTGVCSG